MAYYLYKWVVLAGGITFVSSVAVFPTFPRLSVTIAPLSLIACVFGLRIWHHAFRRRYQGANPGLDIFDQEITFVVLGNNRYRTTRRIRAKALRDGIECFKHPFQWTGDQQPPVFVSEAGYQKNIVFETPENGISNLARVYFDRPSRKGEKIEIAYSFEVTDATRPAKPFFAITTNDWVKKKLEVNVRFFEGHSFTSYCKQIFISSASEIPIFEQLGGLDERNSIQWVIKKPRPGFRYSIAWK